MKILLVASSYLPNVGGVQRVASQLAIELQKRGTSVSVVAPRYPRTLSGQEVIEGIPVTRWHFLVPRLRDVRQGRLALFFASWFYFPATLARLIWKIVRDQPQVVNLHFVGAPSVFILVARSLLHFRLVISLHGDDVEGFARQNWIDRWIFRAALARADVVTACSAYLLKQARYIAPEIESKSQVIYNGIAEFSFPQASGSGGGLVAVGRLVSKKGFDIFLCALAELSNDCARLIGDGPERAALERLAHELGIQDRVEFTGAQTHEEVIRSMRNSQLIVIPSRQEPFGLVALEALALGKPIVAARVGGLPEILDGGDEQLVEPENPSALAQAIREVQKHIAQDPHWGARNSALAARFSLREMVDQYARLYSGESAG